MKRIRSKLKKSFFFIIILISVSSVFASGGKMTSKTILNAVRLSDIVSEILQKPQDKSAVINIFGTTSSKLTDYQIEVMPMFSNIKSIKIVFSEQSTLINIEGINEIVMDDLKKRFNEVISAPVDHLGQRPIIMIRNNQKHECRLIAYLKGGKDLGEKIKRITIRCDNLI